MLIEVLLFDNEGDYYDVIQTVFKEKLKFFKTADVFELVKDLIIRMLQSDPLQRISMKSI